MPNEEFWGSIKKGIGEFAGDMFGPMGIGPRQHDMKERMYPAWNQSRKRRKRKVRDSSSWWRTNDKY